MFADGDDELCDKGLHLAGLGDHDAGCLPSAAFTTPSTSEITSGCAPAACRRVGGDHFRYWPTVIQSA